jgi:hypothetical protein
MTSANDNSRDTSDILSSSEKADWRLPMVRDLAKVCKAEGLSPTSADFHIQVLHVFFRLAGVDAERPKDQQIGYVKAVNKYKDPKAQTQIVTLVRKNWPTIDAIEGAIHVQLPQMQANPFDSLPTAPSQKLFKMPYAEPFQGVLSVTLNSDYDLEGVKKALGDCLRSKFPDADVVITEATFVKSRVVDLNILHRGFLSELWKALAEISWITSVCTKPLSEFGFPLATPGSHS